MRHKTTACVVTAPLVTLPTLRLSSASGRALPTTRQRRVATITPPAKSAATTGSASTTTTSQRNGYFIRRRSRNRPSRPSQWCWFPFSQRIQRQRFGSCPRWKHSSPEVHDWAGLSTSHFRRVQLSRRSDDWRNKKNNAGGLHTRCHAYAWRSRSKKKFIDRAYNRGLVIVHKKISSSTKTQAFCTFVWRIFCIRESTTYQR